MIRLLRSTCLYCFHLRIAKSVVNRYVCKLKLIQHGLLMEAQQLDDIQVKTKPGAGDNIEMEDEDEDDMDSFLARRERFVNQAIRRSKANSGNVDSAKVMSVAEMRRALVKEFMGEIIRFKKCNRCQA